jgi:hypothetical protein
MVQTDYSNTRYQDAPRQYVSSNNDTNYRSNSYRTSHNHPSNPVSRPVGSYVEHQSHHGHSSHDQVYMKHEQLNPHAHYVDKQFEVIVEKPVTREIVKEVEYDVIVEKPTERIHEEEVVYEHIIENPIVKRIEKPIEVIKEQQKIIEKKVENIIEKVYEIPIVHRIEREKEYVTRKTVPIKKIVHKNVDRVSYQPYKQTEKDVKQNNK